VLGEKVTGLEGVEVSPSVNAAVLIGGGVIKPRGGKVFQGPGSRPLCNFRGDRVSKLSKPRPGGVKTIGKLPKFKFLETPTDGIIGE
jgi:hypothetical protein